jgi:predicted lysophospholipase L1 biosynthesis ABC-type transport system permease subunit
MTHVTQALPRRSSWRLLPSLVTLALWRVRQTWRLLLVTGAGILAAVVIVCSAPLFSQIALTAGLRGVLSATSGAAQLQLSVSTNGLSTSIIADDQAHLLAAMRAQLGSYLSDVSQLTLQTDGLALTPSDTIAQGSEIALIGVSIPQASAHLTRLNGRLPSETGDELEIALPQAAADALRVSVDSTLSLSIPLTILNGPAQATQSLTEQLPLHVVGIIQPTDIDTYWHGVSFQPTLEGHFPLYSGLMSSANFLQTLTHLAEQQGGNQVLLQAPPTILWYFSLDTSQVTNEDLNDLISRLSAAQIAIGNNFSTSQYLNNARLTGSVLQASDTPSTLQQFSDRSSVVQIPVAILTIQILALILFFISLAAGLFVERQTEAIALLRSRGASRRQVFASFVIQSIGLGLISLVIGPLLAVFVARLLSALILSAQDQSTLSIVTGDIMQAALGVGWYALAAAGGAIAAMLLVMSGAARRDVLAIRRESARSTRRPLWQRLQLDLVAAIFALVGYGASNYVINSGVVDARSNQLIAIPLQLVGPLFLLIAAVLLFLRLFPLLLRFLSWRATRRPGAPSMLALAQVARAPNQSVRMILLLSLAAAFAIFTLVFQASEYQQIASVAAQQVGADFGGNLLKTASSPAQSEQMYDHIPGVLSSSIGYTYQTTSAQLPTLPIQVLAVDTHTLAQTFIWTKQYSSQPITQMLAGTRDVQAVNSQPAIPAIVDAVTWNALQLSPGAGFTLGNLTFVALAEVQHIPTVNDSLVTSGTDNYAVPGGVLVDYTIFNQVQPQAPNYIWLHTSDDPAALARVRAALSVGPLQLSNLNDRRAMIAQMQHDPLYVSLSGVLLLGTITTLLLALVGSLLASWLNARSRLTSFALLRALGSTPRQLASTLAWEQGIVYTVAIVLGSIFGAALVVTVARGLIFTSSPTSSTNISSDEFYVIQHVLPTQIIVPATLGIAFAVLVIICAIALAMMARIVSTPSISQTLRLNED